MVKIQEKLAYMHKTNLYIIAHAFSKIHKKEKRLFKTH